MRAGLLEQREVLVLVGGARVVEHDDANRVAVPPEVLVVLFDGLTDVAQAIGGNDEDEVVWIPWVTAPVKRPRLDNGRTR